MLTERMVWADVPRGYYFFLILILEYRNETGYTAIMPTHEE